MCASVMFACVYAYMCVNMMFAYAGMHTCVSVMFTWMGVHTCVSVRCFHMWACLSLLMCTEATGGCQVLFYHFLLYSPETGSLTGPGVTLEVSKPTNPPISIPPKDGITGMQEAMPGFLQGFWELNSGPNASCRCLHQLNHLLSPWV